MTTPLNTLMAPDWAETATTAKTIPVFPVVSIRWPPTLHRSGATCVPCTGTWCSSWSSLPARRGSRPSPQANSA